MNVGIANLHRWLRRPTEQVWALGTSSPAAVVGLERKGRLAPGADADVVLWNDDFTAHTTWVGGEVVWSSDSA
jgi:N-acetylglucosamine-6-phosphate deacetylase